MWYREITEECFCPSLTLYKADYTLKNSMFSWVFSVLKQSKKSAYEF